MGKVVQIVKHSAAVLGRNERAWEFGAEFAPDVRVSFGEEGFLKNQRGSTV